MGEIVVRNAHSAIATLFLGVLFLIAVVVSPVAYAGTVLFVGGTSGTIGRLVPDGIFGTPGEFLGGAYSDDTFKVVDYPGSLWPITGPFDRTLGASVSIGINNLYTAMESTPGPLVIAGVSQGAMVVQQLEADLNDDPAIPSDTNFIIIADPNFGILRGLDGVHIPILNYIPQPPFETRFITTVVVNEYDGFADPIANPWNLLTDLNAAMAVLFVHPFAQNSDLAAVPPQDIVVTTNAMGGTVTTYFVPTKHLPLTMPLRLLCVPAPIVDAIDNVLRPIIDAGYARNVPYPILAPTAAGARGSLVSPHAARLAKTPGSGDAPTGLRRNTSPVATSNSPQVPMRVATATVRKLQTSNA
ncbi:MAG: PE-PPE domain-containing protein [Candidatus Nanopelagicales bacterium]